MAGARGRAAAAAGAGRRAAAAAVVCRAGAFDEELVATANTIASKGRGILAMDESNGTCGKRLDSIGVENTEDNRRAYRELLLTTKGLGEFIGGAILFEETLYQSCADGTSFVDVMKEAGIVPGIKVDKGLVPMANANGESWCQGLDGLAERTAEYYKQGARFCKWRSTVDISAGPTEIALNDCAYGLARYAAIAQDNGLVPIVEPEVLLDGEHDIDATLKVAENTLKMLKRRVPPAVPGIMFLSGGQSEMEATLNLNAMNQSPNPWHVSFSYARALQNSVLKTWQGLEENKEAAQAALMVRAKANSKAQLGEYDASAESADASQGMYEKGYTY